jgi:similar to stage IV sporulation protein
MTVNVSQSRAEVIVRERTPKPELIDNDAPVDVTARKTGIIAKMNVLQGRPLFGVGDAVVAGETLVTGVMESPYAETRYVHAMAEVEAAVWYELTAEAELCSRVKTYTGEKMTRLALLLGDRRINFYRNSGENGEACDKITEKYPFALKDVFTLPITLLREDFRAYRLTDVRRDESALRESLEAELSSVLENELGDGGEIVSVSFVSSKANGLMTVTLRAECRENIAVETAFIP